MCAVYEVINLLIRIPNIMTSRISFVLEVKETVQCTPPWTMDEPLVEGKEINP